MYWLCSRCFWDITQAQCLNFPGHRLSPRPIRSHKWYCWKLDLGVTGVSCTQGRKSRVQICQAHWKSRDGSNRTSTQRDVLFICQRHCDIWHPLLVDKTNPLTIKAGPFALQQHQSSDCGHWAAWPQGLPLFCLHSPLPFPFFLPPPQPKIIILLHSPSFPSPKTLLTRTDKETGPLLFALIKLLSFMGMQQGKVRGQFDGGVLLEFR